MMRLSWLPNMALLATLTIRATMASTTTLTPSNTTQYRDNISAGPIVLLLPETTLTMNTFAPLQPLFSSGVSNLRSWGLSDQLYHVTPSTYLNLTSRSIAYMSCDAADYPGNIGAGDVLNAALAVNATGILLYSTLAHYCNVSQLGSSYSFIYSMSNASLSHILLDKIESAQSSVPLHGLIKFSDQVDNNRTSGSDGGSDGNDNGNSNNNNSLGASPTTAVAMIILYSITGIITALFLAIIITGAVRAHRHPERYGPRNIVGRARQSRARGLARAMLDTIPIVKFGEREPPKPVDTELAENRLISAEEINGTGEICEIGVEHAAVVAAGKSGPSSVHVDVVAPPRKSDVSTRSGIAPATNPPVSTQPENREDEAPGCSICTDDFELGQDLRVLPCDHKFHPACIDPWLLNVSGTCPLCRIDLNPHRESDSAAREITDLPPPIDGGETAPRVRIGMRQSFLIGLGLGRVHDTTREERIAAIRQLRAQQALNRERRASAAEPDAAVERGRAMRFRERFGIRTSRRGQDGETWENPPVDPDGLIIYAEDRLA